MRINDFNKQELFPIWTALMNAKGLHRPLWRALKVSFWIALTFFILFGFVGTLMFYNPGDESIKHFLLSGERALYMFLILTICLSIKNILQVMYSTVTVNDLELAIKSTTDTVTNMNNFLRYKTLEGLEERLKNYKEAYSVLCQRIEFLKKNKKRLLEAELKEVNDTKAITTAKNNIISAEDAIKTFKLFTKYIEGNPNSFEKSITLAKEILEKERKLPPALPI